MVFEQGVYVIEHDPEKTRAFYAHAPETDCDCSGCRDFRAAVSRMSVEMRGFLEQFGIDPAKPAEMTPLCAVGREALCYDGFYHFCGEIREGLEPFVQVGEKSFQLDPQYQISVGVEEQVWFSADCHLLEPDFPLPAVQIGVYFNLPWVLEEKNTYQ